MNTTTSTRTPHAALVAALLAAFTGLPAAAQTLTVWNGEGGSGSWFNADNWVGGAVPPSNSLSDVLIATATSGTVVNPLTISSARTVRTITFDNNAGQLPATLNIDTNLSGTTARTLTIHGGITLANTTTTVAFRGNNGVLTIALAANNTFNVSSGAQLSILNDVLVTGSSSIEKIGAGSLLMGTGKTFSGGLVLTEGRLRTNGSSTASGGAITGSPFGTGTLTLRGGILQSFSGTTRTYHNSVLIDGNVALGGLAPDDVTVTGQQTFSTLGGGTTTVSAGTHTLDVRSAVVWNQNIGGTGGLIKTGGAGLSFAGDNTFSGGLQIAEGAFTLTSAGSLRFNLGDGGLANSVSGVGSATFDGTFVLDRSAVTAGTGTWNLVNVATLSESFGGSFTLRFLDETGSFTDAGGGLYTFGDWSFSTATGALSLAPVPEPSAFAALAGLGALGFASQRRRRR